MFVPQLQTSMAAALNTDPSNVPAVNIDSNNALNSVTISYVVTYSESSAALLADHDAFYNNNLGPEFAKVDGLAELLGLRTSGSPDTTTPTPTTPTTTVGPVSVFVLSGDFSASALEVYTSQLASTMASLLGISASEVSV